MTNKQKDDSIKWLGLMYLDFDNDSKEYQRVVNKEIKDKLNSYETKQRIHR